MPYGGCSTRLNGSARGGWEKYWYFWWFMMNGVIIYVLLLLNYWYRWLHFEWLDGYGNHSRRVRGLRLTSCPHSAEWRAKQLGSWNVDDDNMIPQPNNILTYSSDVASFDPNGNTSWCECQLIPLIHNSSYIFMMYDNNLHMIKKIWTESESGERKNIKLWFFIYRPMRWQSGRPTSRIWSWIGLCYVVLQTRIHFNFRPWVYWPYAISSSTASDGTRSRLDEAWGRRIFVSLTIWGFQILC